MDELFGHMDALESSTNLSKSIKDVEKAIKELEDMRTSIAKNPTMAPVALAKSQIPFKTALEKAKTDLLPMYKTLGRYGKAVDKKFKDQPLPSEEISLHPELLDRAIAYQLLRDGHFDVYHTFVHESTHLADLCDPANPTQHQFEVLHRILADIRHGNKLKGRLHSAIEWARENVDQLDARGSDLLFELCRQQFINIISLGERPNHERTDEHVMEAVMLKAYEYANEELQCFSQRYEADVNKLITSIPFITNIDASPYSPLYDNSRAFDDLARYFTREYCALLNLPAESALFTAANAGAIALPTILRVQNIMAKRGATWSTEHELPVETPLPPKYHFHSIFVCAVSKEQSTDENPPMMLPCGHLVSKESLVRMTKGPKVKCHYCPHISRPQDAIQVVL